MAPRPCECFRGHLGAMDCGQEQAEPSHRHRLAWLRGALVASLAVAGCAEPPHPAPPAPLPPPPSRPAAPRCAYGLLGPEVSLTPDVAKLLHSSVAWAAGRLLL